ncbi:hypothetical protein [Draconibacterium mangrovi]|uniref:hypothetical protein n=1 Tax=Draconibacterium mangrovi TaxID=2697469 RepID=UPI0013D596B2|nr:hypothetical protein [Draconibacterium mangrovi]
MNQNFLIIPITLCEYAVREKRKNELQLLCWLKVQCSGNFMLTNNLKNRVYNQLKITLATFKSRLAWLLEKSWVEYNEETKRYWICSFTIITKMMDGYTSKAVIWDYNEFDTFKAFVDATMITFIAKRKYFYDKQGYRCNLEYNRYKLYRKRTKPQFYPLPVSYLSKALGISDSSASNMKKNASNAQFIIVKKNIKKLDISVNEYKFLKDCHPEGKRYLKRGNVIYEQLPDSIQSYLVFKIKRNLVQ